ncbi:peptidylprolyl isomerase [Nitrospira sp. Kam-Ns4a]
MTPTTTPSAGLACRRLVVSLALALWLLLLPPAVGEAALLTDRIVAVVNNEVITLSELKNEAAPEEQRLREQYRGAELARRLQQLEYTLLTRMIERKLQIQYAANKGVDVSDDEVRSTLKELQRQGEKFDYANPQDRKLIKEQLVLMRLVDREVRSGVMVSEPEMKRYYEEHLSRFMLPDEYRISQILLRRRRGQDQADLQSRARDILAALRQGADFADLALRYSDGPQARQGGSLGFVRQGELQPAIERAIAKLQPNQVSEPVETPEGLHIIRLEEKKPPQFRPFAEVKNEIKGLVFQQKTEDMYERWMRDLKNKAYIEIKF